MVIESRKLPVDDTTRLPVNLKNLREEHRIVSGIHEMYGSLYGTIGFGALMKGCPTSSGIMKDIVIGRLSRACSKKATVELLETDFGIGIPLEKVYRMLDTLS